MNTYNDISKILEVDVVIVAIPPVIDLSKIIIEPEIFSKAWEWDQLCNHCID